MEIVFYFFGIALLVASVFLMLDTQQNRRLNKLSRETKNVQPLFLQRAAEQKLNTLNGFLFDQDALNDQTRQVLSARLNMIMAERNSGKMSLQAYNGKLNELISMTRTRK